MAICDAAGVRRRGNVTCTAGGCARGGAGSGGEATRRGGGGRRGAGRLQHSRRRAGAGGASSSSFCWLSQARVRLAAPGLGLPGAERSRSAGAAAFVPDCQRRRRPRIAVTCWRCWAASARRLRACVQEQNEVLLAQLHARERTIRRLMLRAGASPADVAVFSADVDSRCVDDSPGSSAVLLHLRSTRSCDSPIEHCCGSTQGPSCRVSSQAHGHRIGLPAGCCTPPGRRSDGITICATVPLSVCIRHTWGGTSELGNTYCQNPVQRCVDITIWRETALLQWSIKVRSGLVDIAVKNTQGQGHTGDVRGSPS